MVLNNMKFKLSKRMKRAGSFGKCNIGDGNTSSNIPHRRPKLIIPPFTDIESTYASSTTSGQHSSRLTPKGIGTGETYIAPYTN